jgi:hypothetical protein
LCSPPPLPIQFGRALGIDEGANRPDQVLSSVSMVFLLGGLWVSFLGASRVDGWGWVSWRRLLGLARGHSFAVLHGLAADGDGVGFFDLSLGDGTGAAGDVGREDVGWFAGVGSVHVR